MTAILRREFYSYFTSPIGYIYLSVFYFFSGIFFNSVVTSNSTDVSPVFSSLFTILLVLIPLLTMRLMSEEKKQKTDQLLLTSPVSLSGLVYGKFLAAFCIYALGIAVTVIYAVVLAGYATPEWAVVAGNILGALLLGFATIAIGIFISSLTENQMIAAIGTFAVMLFIYFLEIFASLVKVNWIMKVLISVSFTARYAEFTSGVLNLSNVLYFVSIGVIFNFLTVRVLEKRRWS